MSLAQYSKLIAAFLTGAAVTAAAGNFAHGDTDQNVRIPKSAIDDLKDTMKEGTPPTILAGQLMVSDVLYGVGTRGHFLGWGDDAPDAILANMAKADEKQDHLFISRREPVFSVHEEDVEQTCVSYKVNPEESPYKPGQREFLYLAFQLTEPAYKRLIAAATATLSDKDGGTVLDLTGERGLSYGTVQLSRDSLSRLPADLSKGDNRTISVTFTYPFIGVGVDFLSAAGAGAPVYPCIRDQGFGQIRALVARYAPRNPNINLISNMLEIRYPNHP